jgi:uncharacterized protein YceK
MALSGCATVMTLKKNGVGGDGRWGGSNKTILIYSGTAADFGAAIWGHPVLLLDMPFSFVADTLVLPYTVTVTAMGKNVYGYSPLDPQEPKKCPPKVEKPPAPVEGK